MNMELYELKKQPHGGKNRHSRRVPKQFRNSDVVLERSQPKCRPDLKHDRNTIENQQIPRGFWHGWQEANALVVNGRTVCQPRRPKKHAAGVPTGKRGVGPQPKPSGLPAGACVVAAVRKARPQWAIDQALVSDRKATRQEIDAALQRGGVEPNPGPVSDFGDAYELRKSSGPSRRTRRKGQIHDHVKNYGCPPPSPGQVALARLNRSISVFLRTGLVVAGSDHTLALPLYSGSMRCLKRYEKAVKKATSEQKELLTQGIEPNPGPVYREDSIEFADVVGPVVAFANAHHRTILIAILRDGLLTVFDPEEIAGVPCLGARIAAMPMRREGNVCVVITRQPYASLVSGDCVCCVHACAFDTSDAADLLLWIRQRLVGIEPNPGPEDYPYAMYLGFREEGRLYELFADDSFNTLTRVQRASLLVVPILLNSITPSNDISTIREHEMSFVLNGRLMCVGFRDRLDLATFLFQLLMTQGVEPNPGPVSFNDWADSHKHTKVLVLSPDASALLAKQTDDVWTIGENEFKRLATDQKPCPFAEFRLDVNMIPMLSANPAKPTERLCPCKQKVVFLERRNAKCTRHLFHCPPPEYFFDERKNEDVDVLTGKWDLDESIAALWRLNRMAMKKKPELVEEYKKKCEEQSKIRPRTVCYCQQHPDGMFVFPTVPSLAKAESAPAAPAVPTAASTDPLDPPPKGNLDAIAASLLPQDWARVPNMFKAQVPSLLPTEPAAKSATNAPTSCCRATKKETHGVLTGCVPEFEELERISLSTSSWELH